MPRSCGRGWRSCAAARRGGRRPSARCWRSRAATRTTGPPTRRCRCRSPPCTRDGFLGDLLAGRRRSGDHAGRRRRRASTRSCAPTSSGGCRGWRSSPSWGWAPASPTTWAWARRCSCSRWSRTSGPAPRRAHPAAVPDVAGRHLAAGGAAVRPRAAGAGAARARPPARRRAARRGGGRRPGRHHVRHRHPRRRGAGRRSTWRRLVLDEAQAVKNSRASGSAGGAPDRRRAPGRAHRHPGGEPAVGALVDDGRAQPRPAGHRRPLPRALRGADRAARRRRGGVAAAHDHPALPAAPGQDRSHHHRRPAREDRDHAALPAHAGAGHALPHGRRRHDGEDRGRAGHPAPRQRARRDGQAEAGLQPPGPAPARRLRASGGGPASSSASRRSSPRSWPRATGCCASPSSPSSGTCCVPHLSARFDTRRRVPARRAPRRSAATRWWRGSRRARARRSCCSRSRRAAPGSRSPRPTTWSTSTGGGTRRWRTRPPTARSASGSGATSRCASSSAPARVEERIDAMIAQKTALARTGRRRRRELAHRAVHRQPPRPVPARRGGGGGRLDELVAAVVAEPRRPGRSRSGRHPDNTTRGSVARTWWSKRFLAVLEQIGVGGRMARGRAYARQGQIISLDVDAGGAVAAVQGSRPRPYAVRVGVLRVRQGRVGRGRRRRWSPTRCSPRRCSPARCRDEIEEVFTRVGALAVPGRAPAISPSTAPAPTRPCRASTWPRSATCWPSGSTPTRSRSWPCAGATGRRCSPICAGERRGRGGARPRRTAPRWPRCCPRSTPEAPCRPPAAGPDTPSDALLDQVPPFPVEIRGITVSELLRPAYRALGGA